MRRTRAPGAGNTRELRVMDVLAAEGWLCASRRHIGGAGDVLAVRLDSHPVMALSEAMLIEVKSTTRSPWHAFPPADRQDLIETAARYGCDAWLFWWPPRKSLQRIHFSAFPKGKVEPQVEGYA